MEHRRHTLSSLGGRTGFTILSVQTLGSLQLSLRRASARLWLAILTVAQVWLQALLQLDITEVLRDKSQPWECVSTLEATDIFLQQLCPQC